MKKNDSHIDKNLLKAVERFLPAFSKLFYYNKTHTPREFEVFHQHGNSDKTFQLGRKIELNQECFSLLWLIDDLIESSYQTERMNTKVRRFCLQEELSQCFYWRRTEDKKFSKELKNKFTRLMKKLHATDMIGHEDRSDNRNYKKVYLTARGKRLLSKLKEERAKGLARIFHLSEIGPEKYLYLADEFDRMAKESWSILVDEARQLPTK